MAYILILDTATETAQAVLAKEGQVLQVIVNRQQQEHAAFLQPAVRELLLSANITADALAAVAVINGPGSYTGLRVGLASAKGLCFALNIPLITIGTLAAMVHSAVHTGRYKEQDIWYCPMIDARRMEVFTGVFNALGEPQTVASAMVLDAASFESVLQHKKVVFFGSGAEKWSTICTQTNALFEQFTVQPGSLALIAHNLYDNQCFSDVAYAEPDYLKAFFSTQKRQSE